MTIDIDSLMGVMPFKQVEIGSVFCFLNDIETPFMKISFDNDDDNVTYVSLEDGECHTAEQCEKYEKVIVLNDIVLTKR